MEIDIIEGARGTGKSTLAFKLRQRIPETTLINFTGFHLDGLVGLAKVNDYYSAWMTMFYKLHKHDFKFVFDRFYFSERIYSHLYKKYDFKDNFIILLDYLEMLSHLGVKINIFYLTINDKEELSKRLIRDKVPFGKAEESVLETLKQQNLYAEIFEYINDDYSNENLKVHTVDTSGKTDENVYDEILQLKTTN